MERMTIRTPSGAALKMADHYPNENAAKHDLMVKYRIAMERLADYEDTGLEPGEFFSGLEIAKILAALKEAEKYKQAESEGCLMVLPCKIGDTVWVIGSEDDCVAFVCVGIGRNYLFLSPTLDLVIDPEKLCAKLFEFSRKEESLPLYVVRASDAFFSPEDAEKALRERKTQNQPERKVENG